jgi:hypothetical protein
MSFDFETGSKEADVLGRALSKAVDRALKEYKRDPANPPTDGQIAVMVIFSALDGLGLRLVPKRTP